MLVSDGHVQLVHCQQIRAGCAPVRRYCPVKQSGRRASISPTLNKLSDKVYSLLSKEQGGATQAGNQAGLRDRPDEIHNNSTATNPTTPDIGIILVTHE
jgi:hypothetical protein